MVDLVDNVIVVHMDKKRDQLKNLPQLTDDQQDYMDNHFDMLLGIQKQRHGAFEGTFAFYNHPSLQMTAQEGKPLPFEFDNPEIEVQSEARVAEALVPQADIGQKMKNLSLTWINSTSKKVYKKVDKRKNVSLE